MSQSMEELEQSELDRLKQGTYSDILFVLLPFLAILLQRLWTGEVNKILLGYEISTAAAILGGLSISKFIQGLVTHPQLGVKKERLVFIIALTIFCVVVPALILTMKLVGATEVPPVIAYIQPILMVIAVSLYISAIRIVKSFETLQESEDADLDSDQGGYNMNMAIASESAESSAKRKG
ncbi:MAG: hypothetical protein MI867_11520 [Pseudomonadales bacterium]|nr:hypothetical protein [Pseudomonadales bacterium]